MPMTFGLWSKCDDFMIDKAMRNMDTKSKIEYLLTHKISKNINNEKLSATYKLADRVTKFSFTNKFIFSYLLFAVLWMVFNLVAPGNLIFDCYPYNFLSLILSLLITVQSTLIGISQKRESDIQKIKNENEYEINYKTECLIEEIYKEIKKGEK